MSENSSARTWVIEPDRAEMTSGNRSVMPPGWMPVPCNVTPAALAMPSALAGQQRGGALQTEPSGRARTTITFRRPPSRDPLTLTVDYGQPHARGRAGAGGVVPWDRVWRTGANAATTLTTDVDLVIGGARVPKGSYTLYTLPSRAGWKLIINRQTGQWGTGYGPAHDLGRVPMTTETLGAAVEQFTIAIDSLGARHGTLSMSWGTFRWSVPLVVR